MDQNDMQMLQDLLHTEGFSDMLLGLVPHSCLEKRLQGR